MQHDRCHGIVRLLAIATLGCTSIAPAQNARIYATVARPEVDKTSASTKPDPLESWFRGGIAGKKIVYWGNSTVSNALEMFKQLGKQTAQGGVLEGIEYRTDIVGVEADSSGDVTVTLAAPVTYTTGQWVSPWFANPTHLSFFWQPSVQITAVAGDTFTYKRQGAPKTAYSKDSGHVSGHILNYGNNGATLSALLATPYPLSAQGVCDAKPDLLIIRGPLINDVRLGGMNLSEATQLEREALDRFEACIPDAAILLTTENSLLTTDTGQHWVVPNADAQAYTNILHDAVMAMDGLYPNVKVVDVMAKVYGTICPASSPLMANQLHPSDAGQDAEAPVLLDSVGSPYPAYGVNFGAVEVGSAGTTKASASVGFNFSSALKMYSIQTLSSGASNGEFAIENGAGSCSTQATYTANEGCEVHVTFAPKYPGLRRGALVLRAIGGAATTVYLYGNGLAPQVALSPGAITSIDGGSAKGTEFNAPQGVSVDGAGRVLIADTGNNVIREMNTATNAVSAVAGNGTPGYAGDGGAAGDSELSSPAGIALDGAGNLFIADTGNNVIRRVDAGTKVITTVAGNGKPGYAGDDGAATGAELSGPGAISIDGAGNLFIADTENNVIREVDAATKIISTVAGNGTRGYSGDGRAARNAKLSHPSSVAVDAEDNLFIADNGNSVIRRVSGSTRIISTVAGNGKSGYEGDGGRADRAELMNPEHVVLDAAGDLYITDTGNNVIRKVDAATQTIATLPDDSSSAMGAKPFNPTGMAIDGMGDLLVADAENNAIREMSTSAVQLRFSPEPTGRASTTKTVTVSNIGNSALDLVGLTGSDAVLNTTSSSCAKGSSLAAGASCTLAIEFVPKTVGINFGSLLLSDDALNATKPNYSTQKIPMEGSGVLSPPRRPIQR